MWVPPIAMLNPDVDVKAAARREEEEEEEEETEKTQEGEGDDEMEFPCEFGKDAERVELRLSPLLGGLALQVPFVFEQEIIARHLDDHARAMLARTCRDVRAVVLASGAPRAGAASFNNNNESEDDNDHQSNNEKKHHHHTLLNAKHFTRRMPLTRWAMDNGMPLHWRTMEYAGRASPPRGMMGERVFAGEGERRKREGGKWK